VKTMPGDEDFSEIEEDFLSVIAEHAIARR
jgi:hypothetical protein